MGIVKIASGEPAAKSGYSCGDEDLTRDERMLLQSFPVHEPDDSELAEVDCELAMSRGQICNVPYGLYDLPDLMEVLSLETWNSCLTEDDRFCLAASLPDMEQHDFVTTMKELFNGDAMFFGSPLRSFFLRLKGGLYSPQVSQARELLMTFQKRRHYHFLKLYHDGMAGKFASVAKVSRSSDTSTSLRAKVPISHNWAYEKSLPCVGLSISTLPTTIKGETATVLPMKRAKLMDVSSTTHCSTIHNETDYAAKSAEMNSLESPIFHPPSHPRQNCSKVPKGVLKIRTGCASLINESKGSHHRPGLILVDQLGMQSSSFCAPPHAFAHDVHGFSENSSSHINTVSGTSASQQPSPLQWKGTLETYALIGKSPPGVQMTVPEEHNAVYPSMMLRDFYPAANLRLTCVNDAYDTRKCAHMKDLLKNFGHQNNIAHQSSPDPCARASDDHQMNGYKTTHSSRNAESISEMLNLGTRMYPPHNSFPEQLETMSKYHDGIKLEAPPAKPVTEVGEARQFAYTYARRKPHKRSTMVEDAVSPSVLNSMTNMKAKAIKL
ncbi:hypothetical protein SEVIR_6G206900v4 [Setaria viridis]|uniref:DEUBAD domain-containing protein n=1 Tax=Setaria viridis TaxID=4556 RepID=A0A4U6UAP7_SETVI|nr:uncharacterized protein LOC117861005 [Setaria viridis]XP_034600347.1 uncharacterized protein LOC117861005 [Setaria viridis]XP_034600348.1 uncharacterized protein LOC117861005 [Setaria viridis]TKW11023.1 hypothetical protein SEVIR_6G206900v2 [Setaria viridis]